MKGFRTLFIVLLIVISAVLSFKLYETEMRKEMLGRKIGEMEELVEVSVSRREAVINRSVELEEIINELEEEKELLEKENKELKELLTLRYNTYVSAVNYNGDSLKILTRSGFNAALFERAWENMGAKGMSGTGESFVKAEKETGVNALVLAAIAAHESGFGTSKIARDKNNLYGYRAFNISPYESAKTFSSRDEGTMHVAGHLSRNYLSRDGMYFKGENLSAVNIYYAKSKDWSEKVARMMENIARNGVREGEVELWLQIIN